MVIILREKKSRIKIVLLTMIIILVTMFIPAVSWSANNMSVTSSEWAKHGYVFKLAGAASGYSGYYASYNTDKDDIPEDIGWTTLISLNKTDSDGNVLNGNTAEADTTYCCDLLTHTVTNARYKKTVLESATYFDPSDSANNALIAKKIRSVLLHGYPYLGEAELTANIKTWLNEDSSRGQLSVENRSLDKATLITGTQMAIWSLANSENAPIGYYSDKGNSQGGGYQASADKRNSYNINHEKDANIVKAYLLANATNGAEASADQVVIGDAYVTAEFIEKSVADGGGYVLSGEFAFCSDEPKDEKASEETSERLKATPDIPVGKDITISISMKKANGQNIKIFEGKFNELITKGLIVLDQQTLEYRFELPIGRDVDIAAQGNETEISVDFSGQQQMPRNAYFYQTPESYQLSQNLVGISSWINPLNINANTMAKIKSKYTVSVEKVWEDNNNQDGSRPESVKVQLYADGQVYGDPVVLNKGNKWGYTWNDLEKYSKSEKVILYTVKEIDIPEGYTSVVTGSTAEGFIITGKHVPEATIDDTVSTGDDSCMVFWLMTALTILAIMVLVIVMRLTGSILH